MRFVRYTVLTVIGLFAGALATAQTFELQNPFPMTSTLLYASNSGSTVYACGMQGAVLKSTDGGTHWGRLLAAYDPAIRYNNVMCANASTVYVFGSYNSSTVVALKTTDGGNTFSSVASGLANGLQVRDAHFTVGNTSDIWAAGYNTTLSRGALYHTVNGGGTWTERITGATIASGNYWYNDLHFPTASTGYAVGFDQAGNASIFVATTNGGTSWTRRVPTNIPFPTGGHMRGVYFTSASNGFVVGHDGSSTSFLLQTGDGGLTWTRRTEGDIASGRLLDVEFLSGNMIGWAVGDSTDGSGRTWQVILGTTDGGNTWNRQDNSVTPGSLNDVQPASSMNAWAVGTTGNGTALVMNYIGSGLWYQQSRSYFGGNLRALSFPSRTIGYAVGGTNAGIVPTVMNTQNAGYSWSALPVLNTVGGALLNAQSSLYAVQFFGTATGWIAGQNNNVSCLYQTKNGGQSWLNTATINGNQTNSAFYGMRFQDVVIGYACGRTGGGTPMIYSSTDAGVTWTQSVTNVPNNPGAFTTAAAKPGMGLVAGYQTVSGNTSWIAMRTVDGGSNWTLLSVPNSWGQMNAKGSWAASADTAWVVGSSTSGGWIARSTNLTSAATFSEQLVSGSSSLNGVYFITNLLGYVVGQKADGTAFFAGTTDGGQTWTQYATNLPVPLNATYAALTNQADVFVAGNSEAIAHSTINLPQAYSYPSVLFLNTTRTTRDTAISYFAIANTGTAPLLINTNAISWSQTSDGQVPNDYVLDPQLTSGGTLTIQAGVVDSFRVVFGPHTVGPRFGYLNIPSNTLRGDTVKVQMRGFGGTSSMNFAVTPLGTTFPTLSMHNDTVLVGSGGLDDTLFVRNDQGSARLNIGTISITGVNADDYTLTRTITQPINPGAEDTLVVHFTPSEGYNRLARMNITSDAFINPNALVLLNGFGGCTEAAFATTADTLFKGVVLTPGTADTIAYDTVIICNVCALPVNILSQSITGTLTVFDYVIVDSLQQTIPQGGCDTAVIAFYPSAQSADTAPRYATFVVKTNGRLSSTMKKELAGTACSRLMIADPVAFGDTIDVINNPGAKITHVTSVTNTGACDMNIDSVGFFGDSTAWSVYKIVHAPIGGVLARGASDSLVVEFAPADTFATEGVHPVAVILYTNSPTVSAVTVNYNDVVVKLPNAVREGTTATSFALEQNFPNPFTGATMFRYAIPTRQHVTLTVMNTLGQVVATPVNEVQDGGRYRVDFSSASLPAGQYIYELRTGTTVISHTMTVLR